MNIVTGLSDIVKNLGVISTIANIKVVGSIYETKAESLDGRLDAASLYMAKSAGDRLCSLPSVICHGKLFSPIDELSNSTIGLGNLSVFKGFVSYHQGSTTTLLHHHSGATSTPSEIHFEHANGCEAWYRLTGSNFINTLIKVPSHKIKSYQIKFTPNTKNIKIFEKIAAEAAKDNISMFWPTINARGVLYFSFDSRKPSNDTIRFEFARELPYIPIIPYQYSAKQILQVLSLAFTSKSVTMEISNEGCIKLQVNSGLGAYQFIFPGQERLIWSWDQANLYPQVWGVEQLMHDDKFMHPDWLPADGAD